MSKKIMKKIIPSILHINKGPKQQQQQQQHHHHHHHHHRRLWQWRPSSCNHHPETLSFRCTHHDDNAAHIIFKTHNSIFLHPAHHHHQDDLSVPDSCFTSSSNSDIDIDHNNYNTNTGIVSSSEELSSSSSSMESIIRGAVKSSDRLFFEPKPGQTSSILLKEEGEAEEEDLSVTLPFKESIALALESEDPYWDFKESMREMVESQGLKKKVEEQDWESLEELLGWYLRMNKRMNHGIIVGAFVDLLLGLALADDHHNNKTNNRRSSSSASSYSSADSCFSSPHSVEIVGEIHEDS